MDVLRSRDGKLVCIHDQTVDRTTDGEGRVDELTYRQIQAEGPESFYTGTLSQKIVQDLNNAGSKISQEDLNQYQAVITDPLFLRYREKKSKNLYNSHTRSKSKFKKF